MSYGKKFFSGNSIEQAVLQAARHFKIEASELAYRKVERRHGFLKSRRRAVIEVDVANPKLPADAQPTPADTQMGAEAPAVPEARPTAKDRGAKSPPRAAEGGPRPSAKRAPRPERERESDLTELPDRPERQVKEASGELAEAAREAAERLLRLGDLNVETEIYEGEEGLEIEVRGEDEDLFLEDRGRLLLAMQHLMPRLIRGLTGETVPCRVDCDNFQEIRAEQLRVLAQRVAKEVRDRGRPRTLEPMSPDERRIIHMTLADDSAVETESQGTGLFKRVMVMPAKRRPRGFDPYNR